MLCSLLPYLFSVVPLFCIIFWACASCTLVILLYGAYDWQLSELSLFSLSTALLVAVISLVVGYWFMLFTYWVLGDALWYFHSVHYSCSDCFDLCSHLSLCHFTLDQTVDVPLFLWSFSVSFRCGRFWSLSFRSGFGWNCSFSTSLTSVLSWLTSGIPLSKAKKLHLNEVKVYFLDPKAVSR